MTIRAFIAVELSDELRRDVARVQEQLKAAVDPGAKAPGVRTSHNEIRVAWVKPASMHLTLKFLGDVDESIAPRLHASVSTAIHDHQPIAIPFMRLGAFPRLKDPRNLWIGPDDRWQSSDEARRLKLLARAIDECCRAQGIAPEDRPFSPHLTLGRVKAGERQIGRALAAQSGVTQPFQLPPLVVSQVTLMKSQLDSKGAIHTPLWTLRL